jgi:RNA polymerase sigma-70 factor (ECF subfamily)
MNPMSLSRWSIDVAGEAAADGELVRRCLQGTRSAWEDFARAYEGTVVRAVRHTLVRLCRRAPPEDVENVVQDIFSGLLEDSGRKLRMFSGRCSLKGWLRAVAMRRTVNYVRDERRRRGKPLDERMLFVPEDRHTEADETMAERIRRLDASLDLLSVRDRLVLRLYYLDGVPLKSIAVLLGVSRNTIWPLVTRARQRLYRRMCES